MTAVSFQDKFLKNRKEPMHLIRTQDSSGKDCYYVIMASGKKIEMFKNSNDAYVDLNEYGIIVTSGWGHEPSDEIKQMLKEKYNFDAYNLN